jgi:catalase
MPLPSDEKLLSLSQDVLQQFETIFGSHPGFRPAHAKGTMLSGTFTPSGEAASLTRAPHASRPVTPVLARFSDATGIPVVPDNDPNANPRGLAVRFVLGDHVHTDIISHSTDGFPTRTGQEFLEFLRAAAASSSSPTALQSFLGAHPAALAYVQTAKPAPSSFARERFYGVTAMRFINAAGTVRYGRYRITPDAGVDHIDDAAASRQNPNFLFEELSTRIAKGPIGFTILVQVAQDGDAVNDATAHWPEDRQLVEFGRLQLNEIVPAYQQEQQKIIFDPIPRVDGIEPSDDPLLELRAAIYLISGRRRRQAPMTQASGGV